VERRKFFLRNEIKICGGKVGNRSSKIVEGLNLNFQRILGLKSQKRNISVEMYSYECFLKHALLFASRPTGA